MVKVWFPNMFMKLINVRTTCTPAVAKLQVSPRMTKTEVKEYLRKIYQINVLDVSTANFLGKWKRLFVKRKLTSYKRRNYKVAYVEFDNVNPISDKAVAEIVEAAKK